MVKILRPLLNRQGEPYADEFRLEDKTAVEQIAWESGYYLQQAKKISASSLMLGFFQMMQLGKNSLRTWALKIGLLEGGTVRKSSLHDRLGPRAVGFVEGVLMRVMGERAKQARRAKRRLPGSEGLLQRFREVLLCDSTCEKLPSNLASLFPSSYSHGEPAATLRLQTVYNYTREAFVRFCVGSFRHNDQSATDLILEVARPGDLVLRDLGYFVLENLQKMILQRIFFISKYRPATNLYDPQNGEEIDLLTLFKGKVKVDTIVLLGAKEKIPLRLVAQKLPEEVARQKKQNARKDRNKKTNHSEAYYKLLEWVVFVTNVPPELLNTNEIAEVYRVRWLIEIIFKAWKSHFNFSKTLNQKQMNYWRAIITIYLILIQIAYWSLDVYQYIKAGVEKLTDQPLSVLKYFDVLNALKDLVINIAHLQELDPLIPQFAVHATYEPRKKRQNFKERHIC